MNENELQFALAPLMAMSGGEAITREPVIAAEYARVLRGYGAAIAREGAERACQGRSWRPVPGELQESLAFVVLGKAKKLVAKALATANAQMKYEDRMHMKELRDAGRVMDAVEYGRGLFRARWSIPDDVDLKDELAIARHLDGWELIECAGPVTSAMDALIGGIVDSWQSGPQIEGEGGGVK